MDMTCSSVELLEGSSTSWKESTVLLTHRKPSLSFVRISHAWPLTLSFLLVVFAAFLAAALFLVIKLPPPVSVDPYSIVLYEDVEKVRRVSRRVHDVISGGRILDSISWLSADMHVAGTPENARVIDRIIHQYEGMGMDVRVFEYDVLLAYPNYSKPNTIEVFVGENKEWLKVSVGKGNAKGGHASSPEDDRSSVWWSAYSANGTVEGNIVYANYGRPSDFDFLQKHGISVKGAILLMRFGGVTRSIKVAEAEKRGSVGVILFSDPLHTGPTSGNQVYLREKMQSYPFDMALPGDAVQRGGVLRTVGDPETPSLPSLPFIPRETLKRVRQSGVIPRIPVTPVGSDDATRLMRLLNGKRIHEHRWQGGLAADYRLTGSRMFRLSVSSVLSRRPIRNVVATLRGAIEPDRWVMLGNHMDAWVNGAIDPASGTAILLEVARALSMFAGKSPPRRSVLFCHWDAEEYGLIGSSEWIEQMHSLLDARAIAMLNVDHIAGNATLQVKGVPLLYKVLMEAAESVDQPDEAERAEGRITLLDSWKFHGGRGPIDGERSLPQIGFPIGASDHQVPSAVRKFISSDGSSLAVVARFIAECTNKLANEMVRVVNGLADVVPLSVFHYAQALSQWVSALHTKLDHMGIPKQLSHYDLRFRALISSTTRFREAAIAIDNLSNEIGQGKRGVTISKLNAINERVVNVERMFVDPHAFPSPLHRHLVFSSPSLAAARSPFSIIVDAATEWQKASPAEKANCMERMSTSIARLTLAIESAIELLNISNISQDL